MKLNNIGRGEYMNFKTEKVQSIQLLKIVFAVIISALPAMLALTGSIGLYVMLAVFCGLLAYRIYDAKKIYMPFFATILLAFFVYALISSIWMKDSAGHLLYLTLIVAIITFSALFADYLNKNNDGNLYGRIIYMISVSSFFVSIVNIGVWFIDYIPDGRKYNFAEGFNSNDELGIFMVLALSCIKTLFKKGSKHRKKLIVMTVFDLFTLLMTRSVPTLLFVAILCAVYLLRNKGRKTYISMITLLTSGFILVIITNITKNSAFGDCIKAGLTSPFGLGGGGFISGLQGLSSSYYLKADVGLIALITAASGILGLILCLFLLIRQMYTALKMCNLFSVITYTLTLFIFIIPYKGIATSLIILAALITYNENLLKPISFVSISKDRVKKIVTILLVIAVLYISAGFGAAMKNTAYTLYKNKDYLEAYSWYKVSATINITDDESCVMAAKCLRKSGAADEYEEEAVKYLDKAIKRSKNNAENLAEKARLFSSCERYDRAIVQWDTAIASAPYNDNYKLELSKVLYKVIKINEKGSSETKEAYKKLLAVSESTQNLDIKKEINDIADKALTYTKGELKDEETKSQ